MTQNRFYDLGRKALLTAVIATSALSYSEAARPRRSYLREQQNYSQENVKPKAQLEQKVQGELIDSQLSWTDKQSQEQFKQLYAEYKQVLIKKQKFDSKKEKDLIEEVGPTWSNTKYRIEKAGKYLLREKDPELYLKQYVKDEKEIEKIRSFKLDKEHKEKLKREGFRYWSANANNPDLSDKIFFYEIEKAIEQLKKNPTLPGINLGPLYP